MSNNQWLTLHSIASSLNLSLVPRLLMGGAKKRAWYRLLAHAFNYLAFLLFVMSSIVDRNTSYIIIVLVVGL